MTEEKNDDELSSSTRSVYKSNSWDGVAFSQIRTLNSSTLQIPELRFPYLFIHSREYEPPTGS